MRVICFALLCAASLTFAFVATRAQDQSPQVASPQATPQSSPNAPPAPTQPPTKPQKPESVGDDDVLSVNTDLVSVIFNAVDKDRRFVTTLKPEDIRVFEDDAPQSVSVFQRETDLPVSLALLVDVSWSQKVTLLDSQDAADIFIDSILRPGKDTAAVVSFTGTATLEQDLTEDRARLHHAIHSLKAVPPASHEEEFVYKEGEKADVVPSEVEENGLPGSTAMWDAVWVTSNEVMKQTDARTRRAIIILSDGDDNSSRMKREDAVEAAIKSNTVVYSIGIGDEDFSEKNLKRIAEQTGGRAFFPEDETQLRAAFAEINQELRTQYLVAYSPTNKVRDGGWRRIRLDIVNPKLKDQKIKLTYREGYFATQRAAAPPTREHAPQERLKRPPRKTVKRNP